MSEDIIQIDNLYKSFGEVKAVQNLSFRVKKGELFALGIAWKFGSRIWCWARLFCSCWEYIFS